MATKKRATVKAQEPASGTDAEQFGKRPLSELDPASEEYIIRTHLAHRFTREAMGLPEPGHETGSGPR